MTTHDARQKSSPSIWILIAVAFLATAVAAADAQVRTTGQIVGTAKDPSGAVVPNADVEVTDAATGNRQSGKSSTEGGFVFPALQPGHYRILVTATGFEPAVIPDIVVETGRTSNVDVQFAVAALQEQVRVEGRAPVVETTSSTVSTTVSNREIATLPLSGRDVLGFALLTPGTASSSTQRFSSFNGLPGGAINITLDGINNNSERFRSGGTSFFTFAPVRLGAVEEVTVSTSGLTADAGAEGAVQVQFVTKRGTNVLHWQAFEQFRHDALNSNSWLNSVRGLPKNKLRLNEWGGNVGGPLLKGKLFYFANFEQPIQPSEATFTRTVLTGEAQTGVFRYTATDGNVRTVNVLDIAQANGFPSAIDPFMASQFATINRTLSGGTLRDVDLLRRELTFAVPQRPTQVYPTGRVDWQAAPGLAVRGILNLWWRDLARNPQFPGLDFVNAGFKSTYFILSTGADWTVRPNMFNQISFGVQSNHEEFNPGNTLDVYRGARRVAFPLTLTTALPTNDVMPMPRNNPVYNLIDTVTMVKGAHTVTLGGTFRRTTMWETTGGVAAAGPTFNVGVVGGDPASTAFTTTTIPGVRTTDLANALALYALLTGRISSVSGTNNVDESSHQYVAGASTRREAQNVGGVYVQDQWRTTPQFTLNYGLRWEFTGTMHNTNGIYTSPTIEHLYGPSTAVFQPGALNGVADPQIELRPSPYKGDYVNPAPNVGFAWNPSADRGVLGKLLGPKSVLRASLGLNYYDEGLIAFQTAAGGNPGLTQQLSLNPGQPGFPIGGLSLASTIPPLNTFPSSFAFPLPQSLFTFSRGFNTIDPSIKTPSILNWNIGVQRELGSGAAIEARYVGNHGFNLWRYYDINEVNVIESGFAREFTNAQRNLALNQAAGINSFSPNTGVPGLSPLPIFDAAFGARGSQGALPPASGYTNGSFITSLQQGEAGALAYALAGANGNSSYLCRMVGSALGPCAALGYNTPGPYPINFFQVNPFAAGRALNLLTGDGWSRYNGLQLQYRQRYAGSLTMVANYTYARTWTNRYSDSPATAVSNSPTATTAPNAWSVRDDAFNQGPVEYSLRHALQSYWTYDLPFGGWTVSSIIRVQSGRPFYLSSGRFTFNQYDSGVILNGVTVDDMQKMIGTRPGPNGTELFIDPKLIGADGRANPQYLLSPPTPGEHGQRIWLYGPPFWNVDLSLAKRFRAGGGTFSVEALFLDLFNNTNFLVQTSTQNNDYGFNVNINSTTFGQTTSTTQTTVGPRNVQLRFLASW
jgi:carboxypeptidase family protein